MPALAAGQTADPNAVPGPTVSDPMGELIEPGEAVRLSDEKKVTRWAHASDTEPIRAAADSSARAITRLRYLTEDGFPEVYLVLDGMTTDVQTPGAARRPHSVRAAEPPAAFAVSARCAGTASAGGLRPNELPPIRSRGPTGSD